MRTRQAQQLQADVLALLDEVGSPKPAADDSLEALNQGWCDVYAALIQAGIKWNMQQSVFSTVAGQDTYGSADGAFLSIYWKTAGLDVKVDGTRWRNAHRFQFEQRNDYQNGSWNWPTDVLYDVWGGTTEPLGADGTRIKFITMPNGATQVRHWWFPCPQRLVNPTDVFDGIAGAERAIVYGAAQELAYAIEQFEQGDRWGQLRDRKLALLLATMKDRVTGEAPMARVVRGRPTIARRYLGGGWGWR